MIKNNLSSEELKEIVKLDKVANKEIKWWDLSSSLKLANKAGLLFLISFKNKAVGFIRFSFPKLNKSNPNLKGTIFLNDIYILPNCRGKGLAKKSILSAIKELKQKCNFSKVKLEAPFRLKAFYEKLGFETNHIVMTKNLAK